jgi:hypothetical protein
MPCKLLILRSGKSIPDRLLGRSHLACATTASLNRSAPYGFAMHNPETARIFGSADTAFESAEERRLNLAVIATSCSTRGRSISGGHPASSNKKPAGLETDREASCDQIWSAPWPHATRHHFCISILENVMVSPFIFPVNCTI